MRGPATCTRQGYWSLIGGDNSRDMTGVIWLASWNRLWYNWQDKGDRLGLRGLIFRDNIAEDERESLYSHHDNQRNLTRTSRVWMDQSENTSAQFDHVFTSHYKTRLFSCQHWYFDAWVVIKLKFTWGHKATSYITHITIPSLYQSGLYNSGSKYFNFRSCTTSCFSSLASF